MNPQLIRFHQWQKFKISVMDHHVALSPFKKNFQIAIVPSLVLNKKTTQTKTSFERVSENDLQKLDTSHLYDHQIPMKSDLYITNRFIFHPVYNYEVYAIKKEGKLQALCVIRPISLKGSKVLRFVDFIGQNDAFDLLNDFISAILEEHNAEYLDLYSCGVPSESLMSAGFIKRDTVEGLVVPNYFEPFEQKNVRNTFFNFCSIN